MSLTIVVLDLELSQLSRGVYQAIKDVTFDYGIDAFLFRGDLVGFFMSLPQRRMRDQLIEFAQSQYHGDFKNLFTLVD